MRDIYVFDTVFIYGVVTHNAASLNYRSEIANVSNVSNVIKSRQEATLLNSCLSLMTAEIMNCLLDVKEQYMKAQLSILLFIIPPLHTTRKQNHSSWVAWKNLVVE